MADLVLGAAVAGDGGPRRPISISSSDLTTHAVIFGMTGSGKTGLGVVLIEECLSRGIPVLAMDPKGDLTNLALVFPGLTAAEFEPWVDPAAAAAAGRSVPEFAEQQADAWRRGLQEWGDDEKTLAAYVSGHDLRVYTPGSDAGTPLNVLGSLRAPESSPPESVADEVEGYVVGLLSLIGIAADPLSSREHILLSNIITAAWDKGEDLDLPTLVARVQQPPMRKLGVFDIDQFFPQGDRTALAMRLNGVLAAPGFAAWLRGEPIDIQAMLHAPDGTARCAVVSTAHLGDDQRHSVTAMVLAKLVTWMRRQSGTTDLRALLYMDEVAGYLPPTAEPPAKKSVMLLMKQARAFGLGVVLSTQNPVDIDYKALSNAGTWLVGRLPTKRDQQRLTAGMSSALGGADTAQVEHAIAGLGKRQFLLRRPAGLVESFDTRWARSYLRGPLTRDQIARLGLREAPATPTAPQTAQSTPAPESTEATVLRDDESTVMPPVAAGIPVTYLDPAADWSARIGAAAPGGIPPTLVAGAVARVALRYDDTRAGVDHAEEYEAVVFPLPEHPVRMQHLAVDFDDRDLGAAPPAGARFRLPLAAVGSRAYWTGLEGELLDQLVRSRTVTVLHNPDLKLYSRVGESTAEFGERVTAAASAAADAETARLRDRYETRLRALRDRLAAAQSRVDAAEAARRSQMVDSIGSVLGGFLGGRRSASSLAAAARRQQSASARVDSAAQRSDDLTRQLQQLEADLATEVSAIDEKWRSAAAAQAQRQIPLEKSDVKVTDFRLVWVPLAQTAAAVGQ